MNSPPLEVWFAGSLPGGKVSAAVSIGPGAAALTSVRGGAGCAGAVVGASAAAPVSAAPLRNVRRSVRGRSLLMMPPSPRPSRASRLYFDGTIARGGAGDKLQIRNRGYAHAARSEERR